MDDEMSLIRDATVLALVLATDEVPTDITWNANESNSAHGHDVHVPAVGPNEPGTCHTYHIGCERVTFD